MTTVYEHPCTRREVLTASGESMSRDDADTFGYTVAAYVELVSPAERIATRHPDHFDLAILPPFGLAVPDQTARALGFAVSAIATAPPAKIAGSHPKREWRSAILTLPEANERSAAAVELVTSRTPETLSIDRARAFLRGLPVETTTTHQPEETSMTETDPRGARRAEISQNVAAYNQGKGYAARTAQSVARQAAQPAIAKHVEPAKLKRLAEIRLSAMDHNGKGRTQEAKILRLALDTHASVGTPLDRVFAQLGVDTTKFASSNS